MTGALGCAASSPPSRDVSSKADEPTRAQSAPADPELERRIQTALRYVSQIRGLEIKSKVNGRLISRSEIKDFVARQLEEESPKDVIEATDALLYGLGTVPADFSFRKSVLELMTSQLLGFYDPKRKAFFVGGDLAGDEADATLWHELVHALQDQHYDLERLTKWQPDRGDAQAAVHALAEGDATSVMFDALVRPRGMSALDLPDGMLRAEGVLGAVGNSAPPILVRSLIAPYADGLTFAHFLRRRGDFTAVDEAWRSPPDSTEQLLHPEKFLTREPPLNVPAPAAPAHAPELHERYRDVLGEQTVRIVLEEWVPARTAAQAASDWGGDRVVMFSDQARTCWAGAWRIKYDTEAAAERGLIAFARGALLPQGSVTADGVARQIDEAEARRELKGGQVCRIRHNRGPFAVVRSGPDLAVTLGPFQRNGVTPGESEGCEAALRWAALMLTP